MTHNRFGASTKFRLPLSISFEQIQKIVNETVAGIPRARKDTPPKLLLSSLLDGQQTLTADFGIMDADDQAEALSQFHQGLLKRLSSEGLSLISTPAAPL
jgi:small-conductance mechanosensitive channel